MIRKNFLADVKHPKGDSSNWTNDVSSRPVFFLAPVKISIHLYLENSTTSRSGYIKQEAKSGNVNKEVEYVNEEPGSQLTQTSDVDIGDGSMVS